jgi:hypothetical protein
MSGGGMAGNDRRLWKSGVSVGPVLVLATLAGACSLGGMGSSSTPPPDASASGPSWNFFAGASAKEPQPVANAQSAVHCPAIEIREGASTLIVNAPGETSTMTLRYEGTFTREARECAVVDGNLVMKIGIQGRIIVGPSGGPGQVDVPLRIAVVQETPGGTRPLATKFVRIPVAITNADSGGVFTDIEEAMSFPLPSPMTILNDYVVYIGFDPVTAAAQDQAAKPAPKAKPKHKPDPAAQKNPPSAFSSD